METNRELTDWNTALRLDSPAPKGYRVEFRYSPGWEATDEYPATPPMYVIQTTFQAYGVTNITPELWDSMDDDAKARYLEDQVMDHWRMIQRLAVVGEGSDAND